MVLLYFYPIGWMVLYSFHPIDWTKVHILIEPNKHFKKKQHKILSRGNPLFFRTFPRLINTILPIIILRETIFLVSLQQNNDIIMAQEIIGREPEIKGLYATCSSWHIDPCCFP
jgi:hypothetical protein